MRTAAILPVKRFALAKQRLGATVADPLRGELAQAMVADVLTALEGTAGIELTIVVSGEELLASGRLGSRAVLVHDTAERGQSAAVSLGIARALDEGIERVLCIPGDCPWLAPEDLDGLLAREDGHEVLIIPDRHGKGTNGLLLRPCDAIAPSFGPGSCERHRQLAEAAGRPWAIARPGGLTLDIDTGADLAALRARLDDEPARAPRTRAVLGELGSAPEPAASAA